MNKNMQSASGARNRSSVALGAFFIAAIGPMVSGNALAATSLVAAAQAPAVLANQSLAVNLTVHATVPAGQSTWIQSYSTTGTHGKVVWTSGSTITYSPGSYYASLAKGASAADKLTYCLTDNAGGSSCNTVSVTIFGTAAAATTPPVTPPPVTTPPATTPPATTTSYSCVRNFYVGQNGSDKAAGTTSAAPWLTLQHANDSGQLKAGDCVNVAPGTYSVSNTVSLNHGGNANSATGYVVYRSTTAQGAKIKATARNMQDVVDAQADYMIVDGFEIDGGNLGLTSNPITNGSGLVGTGHHFQALNNLVHDCGGEGIGTMYKDWYWIVGNTTYNNAHFNGYQMSGISIYEPRTVSYTATSADTSATYHIIVKNNVTHDNGEWYVAGAHTDGNGIILDDFRNSQSGMAAYPYKSLVQGNTAYNNGARGVHLFFTDNTTVDGNIAYNNNLDTAINGTWRGELSNAFGTNNTWTNNQGAASSVTTDDRSYNTAVLDGGGNANVTWTGNANFDTRTGGKSYQIDTSTRAAAFPAANPLGKKL
jgi:parallel beta-helix repeat protein